MSYLDYVTLQRKLIIRSYEPNIFCSESGDCKWV